LTSRQDIRDIDRENCPQSSLIRDNFKCNEGYIRELVIELLYTRRNGRAGTRDVMFKML